MSEYVEKEEVLKQIDCWLMTGEYKYSNATHYLDKRISSIKPKSEWISVKDRMPENDGKYMVWYGELDICEFDAESQTFGYTYEDYDDMYSPLVCWDDDIHKDVTHWRPLPEPPESEDDAEIKAFVCTVEDYHGNKNDCRVFANTAKQAREKLIQQFPKHYVSPAVTLKEYMSKNQQKPESEDNAE